MKKHLVVRYLSALLAILFVGLVLLSVVLYRNALAYEKNRADVQLEQSAAHLKQSITNIVSVSKESFVTVLAKRGTLLWDTISGESAAGKLSVFIADGMGKIIMSTDATLWSATLHQASLAEGIRMAREGKSFSTELDGLLTETMRCRVILFEEVSGKIGTPVGAVYLLARQSESVETSFLPIVAITFVVLAAASGALFFTLSHRVLRPLARLQEAAESFANGDFSKRLDEDAGGEISLLMRSYNQLAEMSERNEANQASALSGISHDLRTPLTTISGFLQNMQEGTIPPERYPHYFSIIHNEVDRLSRLVQTLLDTARLQSGKRAFRFAPVDLCELSCVTLLSFEKRMVEKNLDVVFDNELDRIVVFADNDAIQQVIYNLVDNAIKFTPDGGKLTLSIRIHEKKALFSIKNSGQGIPKEELPHVFERFYKSDRSRSLDKNGTGLGLYIVKSILDAHKEEVWVESLVGSYTEFFFSLPLTATKLKGDKEAQPRR